MTNSILSGYKPLICDTPPGYLSSGLIPSYEPGGLPEEWKVSGVGDRSLNMVFIVKGTHKTIIVKQALLWLRAGGEGWPSSLNRADFEYNVLCREAKYTGYTLIPQVYFYDPEITLFVMEYLTPHVILRKELTNGKKFPKLAEDTGRFLAQTLFNTSDIGMSVEQKKALTAEFALNHELYKIMEDPIFTEPYYNTERDSQTSPELNGAVYKTWADVKMVQVAMRYKYKFVIGTQALLYSDLHLGSIMVTDTGTRVIGPEFDFTGPMAFDVGSYIGDLLLAYFSRPGWDANEQRRADYQEWLLQQIVQTWSVFTRGLHQLWDSKAQGGTWPTRMCQQNKAALKDAQGQFFATLLEDSLMNAGIEMNRRVIGFTGVAELKQIGNIELRAGCERHALTIACDLIVNARQFKNMDSVVQSARVK